VRLLIQFDAKIAGDQQMSWGADNILSPCIDLGKEKWGSWPP